jgi:hypothetical protein
LRVIGLPASTRIWLAAGLTDIHSYKHVKALTERLVADALAAIDSARQTPLAQAELCLTQKHDLIRSPDEYADLFARCSTQS